MTDSPTCVCGHFRVNHRKLFRTKTASANASGTKRSGSIGAIHISDLKGWRAPMTETMITKECSRCGDEFTTFNPERELCGVCILYPELRN